MAGSTQPKGGASKGKSNVTPLPTPPTFDGLDQVSDAVMETLGLTVRCWEHSLPELMNSRKRGEVQAIALRLAVIKNAELVAAGGYHELMLFRSDDMAQRFVTLNRMPSGKLLLSEVDDVVWSKVLERWICYRKDTKTMPHTTLPANIGRTIRGDDLSFQVPVLRSVVSHPAIRLDGSFVCDSGYDPVTKLFVPRGWRSMSVPAKPTQAIVNKALDVLREPFADVIFVGDLQPNGHDPVKEVSPDMTVSEANTLGIIITGVLRLLLTDSPFFLITSDMYGTAKGLMADVISLIVTDVEATLQTMPSSVDQMEKQIGRFLKDQPGTLVVQVDEVSKSDGSGGGLYAQNLAALATSRGRFGHRPVFGRRFEVLDSSRLWLFTGVSTTPTRDMTRRFSIVRLARPVDGTEPNARTAFRHGQKESLKQWVRANRADLVQAILVLVANWRAKGCPSPDWSWDYEEWVNVVGGIMVAAGVTNFMENRGEASLDEISAEKAHFLIAVVTAAGQGPLEARQIADVVAGNDNIRDLITWDDAWATKLFGAWDDKKALTRNLGMFLGAMRKIDLVGVSGRVVVRTQFVHGGTRAWSFDLPGQLGPALKQRGRPRKRP